MASFPFLWLNFTVYRYPIFFSHSFLKDSTIKTQIGKPTQEQNEKDHRSYLEEPAKEITISSRKAREGNVSRRMGSSGSDPTNRQVERLGRSQVLAKWGISGWATAENQMVDSCEWRGSRVSWAFSLLITELQDVGVMFWLISSFPFW